MKQFLPVGKRSLGRLDRSKFWGNTSPDCEFCSTYIHLTRWARLKINKKQRDAECLILLGCRNGFSMDFSIVSMFYQWVTQTGFWCGSGFTQKTACSQWRNALVAAPSDSKLEQMRKSCWYVCYGGHFSETHCKQMAPKSVDYLRFRATLLYS